MVAFKRLKRGPVMTTDSKKLVIRNIGMLLSGKIEQPILDGDCLIALNGKITAWGAEKDLDTEGATTEVDARAKWQARYRGRH